jgi:hypothetical protein
MKAYKYYSEIKEDGKLELKLPIKKGEKVEVIVLPLEKAEVKESFEVTQDPVYQMEGYESDAPPDLSVNLDNPTNS